jgi:hypothetical protein
MHDRAYIYIIISSAPPLALSVTRIGAVAPTPAQASGGPPGGRQARPLTPPAPLVGPSTPRSRAVPRAGFWPVLSAGHRGPLGDRSSARSARPLSSALELGRQRPRAREVGRGCPRSGAPAAGSRFCQTNAEGGVSGSPPLPLPPPPTPTFSTLGTPPAPAEHLSRRTFCAASYTARGGMPAMPCHGFWCPR